MLKKIKSILLGQVMDTLLEIRDFAQLYLPKEGQAWNRMSSKWDEEKAE